MNSRHVAQQQTIKVVTLVVACLCLPTSTFAAEAKSKAPRAPKADARRAVPPPTFADVAYAPYEATKLDFWKPETTKPAPLLVSIHGGGFMAGSKQSFDQALAAACLKAGIAHASLEYRFSSVAIYPAQMLDCARAIQFLRSKATEWNLDPQHLACTGGSAGSGISQWLAFHPDLADPKSADPIARLSTRLSCAIPVNMQCTYDPRDIKKIVPGKAYDHVALKLLHGLPKTFDWDKDPIDASLDARLRDCSALTHLTKAAPPIFVLSSHNAETEGNIHHPNFGRHLKKQMDALGLQCEFHLDSDFPSTDARAEAMLAFLKKNFGMK